MTNEQREAIDNLSEIVKLSKEELQKENGNITAILDYKDLKSLDTVLSLIKEQDKKIEHLKENIDYKTLCDFLMSSVSDEEEPIWTEKHIEELLDNFEVRWKDAHK